MKQKLNLELEKFKKNHCYTNFLIFPKNLAQMFWFRTKIEIRDRIKQLKEDKKKFFWWSKYKKKPTVEKETDLMKKNWTNWLLKSSNQKEAPQSEMLPKMWNLSEYGPESEEKIWLKDIQIAEKCKIDKKNCWLPSNHSCDFCTKL